MAASAVNGSEKCSSQHPRDFGMDYGTYSYIFYAILRVFLVPPHSLACGAAVRSPNAPASACPFNHTLHSSTLGSGFANCHSMIRSRMPLTVGPGDIPRTSHTALPYME